VYNSDSDLTAVYFLPETTGWGTTFDGLPTELWDPESECGYTITNSKINIAGYNGSGGDVTIPSTINGLPVIGIGNYAFSDLSSLTSISIPNSVINIGGYAFFGCSGLSSVVIPNSVSSIGYYAFDNCYRLTNVTIGNSVTNIGYAAFGSCAGLTSIYFQGNAPNFGSDIFYGDPATIYYLWGTTGWSATYDGYPATLWDPAVPCAYTTNNNTITITAYVGSGGDVTIPDMIIGLPVTSIGDYAFNNCYDLTSITILDSVTNIGDWAFYSCGLTNVAIGNSVTSIGYAAFGSCAGLTSITIPDSVTSLGDWVFDSCGLTNVAIGSSVTSIGNDAISDCTSLINITIPNNVTSIGDNAFDYCTSLTSVVIPDSVTNIGDGAFGQCYSLTDAIIGSSVTSIGISAFDSCYGLTNITIGNSVTSIGDGAFNGCTSLTGITIPNSIANIGDYAFAACDSLTAAYFDGNAPPDDGSVFSGDTATVYYLLGTAGWGATFGGQPTVPNPQIQTSDASFGIQTNQFGFSIADFSNQVVVVEACTDLANPVWSPVGTNTITGGSSYFGDPQWTNYPGRYYRLRSP
jgi:hypothetical protein